MPTTSGRTPNFASRKSGAHVVPGEEVHRAHLAEELERRQQEREDDADGRQHRDRRRDEQHQVDELLAPADPLLAGERSTAGRPTVSVGRRHLRARVVELLQLLVDLRLASAGRTAPPRRSPAGSRARSGRTPRRRSFSSSELSFTYMKSGRESGVYEPSCADCDARRDAATAAVDLERLQLVLVLLEVGEAEVAERALVAARRPAR